MKRVFSRKKPDRDDGSGGEGSQGTDQPPAAASNIAPSSASVRSQQRTVSTAPSSVFSRAARSSMRTMSSYGSSQPSHHKKFETSIQEEISDSESTLSRTSKPIRLVDPAEMSTLVEEEPTTTPSAPTTHSRPGHTTPYTRTVLLADMPITDFPSPDRMAQLMAPSRGAGSSPRGTIPQTGGGGGGGGNGIGPTIPSGHYRTRTTREILHEVAAEISHHLDQHLQLRTDVTRTAQNINKLLRSATFVSPLDCEIDQLDVDVQKILKCVLHLTDNLLRTPQQQPIRMYTLRSLHRLGTSLQLIAQTGADAMVPVNHPRNFAIGHSRISASAQETLNRVLDTVTQAGQTLLAEQDGAFVAPLARGLAPTFAIFTLSFGFPRPTPSHYDRIAQLYSALNDCHAYCQQNYISVCSSKVEAVVPPLTSDSHGIQSPVFVPPYRRPDPTKPPISVSIATDTATTLSGTLGGYLCPRIDTRTSPALAGHANSTFALTCAHVCLSENNARSAYPQIASPSPVLVNMFKNALISERNKYDEDSMEAKEYADAIQELELSISNKKSNLGQVVWGERAVINGTMSDIAIIRVNPGISCRNYLGDDIPFSSYDPGLMFGNLYIKRTVKKLTPGMCVFKYGSTSKYTAGRVNGPRLVYWADGALQSSEFVVGSDFPGFASGGDSGAWILHKGEKQVGLGVVGMLHSYDGERRELGLFTPIDTVLRRLEEVTNTKWAIHGVPLEDELLGGSDSELSAGEETEP